MVSVEDRFQPLHPEARSRNDTSVTLLVLAACLGKFHGSCAGNLSKGTGS